MPPTRAMSSRPGTAAAVRPRRRRTVVLSAAAWAVVGVGLAWVPARAQRAGYGELKGRWQRPDGGYVLDLRAIDASGRIDAAYLNPQPVNVAKAQATVEGSLLRVFIELRAPNYPGSTYTLTYDAQRDELRGSYFQAVQQQTFEVVFVRMK